MAISQYQNQVVNELIELGAGQDVINAVANAANDNEVKNIIADWQRNSDDFKRVAEAFGQGVEANDDTDVKLPEVAVPHGYVNDSPEADIRSTFGGMPVEAMRPSLALYNNAKGTKYTQQQVEDVLSTPPDVNKEKVDEFVDAYKRERRVVDSLQDIQDYRNSMVGRTIRPAAQVVDAAAGFVPPPYGYAASAVGPFMRAYDSFRQGESVDPANVGQDVMFNVMGQSVGGKVLNGAANLASRIPGLRRYAPDLIRASRAKRMDNASFANPIAGANRRLDQLVAMKAGKSPEVQNKINAEIANIAEWARSIGVRETKPIFDRAMNEAQIIRNEGEAFVRPFTTGEKVAAAVDDGMTKFGTKRIPDAIQGVFNGVPEERPMERAQQNKRKAEIPLLKALVKLDSVARLGYRNKDYEYISRLLNIDSLPPDARLEYAKRRIAQDSLAGDWREEYSK